MNENRNNNGAAGGIGFCGLLAIAFIVLKLTGFIDWSWLCEQEREAADEVLRIAKEEGGAPDE